jgi:hypothetical protein
MRSSLLALPLLLMAACRVDGYYVYPDSPPELPTTVRVSPDGDDANDGLRMPVRTLKRGIGLAASDAAITTILVAAGRYDSASGEAFPYTVPANVTISGPVGGGAILAGTSAEPGLVIGAGELRDLELESFTVAVTSNEIAQLTNLRVRSSGTAIRGEAASRLTVTKLDIAGSAGACATGFELNADADLTASEVSARALGVAFQIKDQTTVSISKANITGDATCNTPSFAVGTTRTFALDESIVDGGRNGIDFFGAATPTTATLTGTTLRNMASSGLVGDTVTFTMTGGELSSNGYGGLSAIGGTWTLNNVTLKQNGVTGIYIQGGGATSPGTLAMRGCTITNNARGVLLYSYAVADLGTVANPGNNTFLANTNLGLDVDYCNAGPLITAVGNTWRPNVQGSDAAGKYPVVASVPGPVEPGFGGNFAIETGCTLRR